jgi:23S rRNA G2445 N2-methylase RlmL
MGNRLFQEARKAVQLAKTAEPAEQTAAMDIAKNALSSAYANTTMAEKEQLRSFQDELNSIEDK